MVMVHQVDSFWGFAMLKAVSVSLIFDVHLSKSTIFIILSIPILFFVIFVLHLNQDWVVRRISTSETSHGQPPQPLEGREGFLETMRHANPSSEREEAWDRFNSKFGNKWRIVWNPQTGLPQRIYGYHTGPGVSPPERISQEFLRAHRDFLGINIDELNVLRVDRLFGKNIVTFQQALGGDCR